MATTTRRTTASKAKTSTTKTASKQAEVVEDNVEVVKAPIVETETVVEEKKTEEKTEEKRKFEPNDLIACTNIFAGTVIMIGKKSGIVYTWNEIGQTEDVEYQDVMAEILKKTSSYVYDPTIIIEDEELIEQRPDLKRFYEKLYSPEELRNLLTDATSNQLKSAIKGLPNGAKESVKNLAATMIQEGTLDSVSKIKAIDELFGTKLLMQTELFQ